MSSAPASPIYHSRTVSRRTLLAGAAAIPASALAGAATGCTGEEDSGTDAAGAPQRVRVLTGLGFQAWEAYLDVAIDMGWFAEERLEVEVLPGEATGGNLQLLEGGQAEFATLDINAAIMEYSAGQDPGSEGGFTGFVLTSVLHANLLACVMALESSGMRRPRDLAGKSIAVIPGGTNTVVFPAFADLASFDADSCELVNLPPPAFVAALAEGQVDAIMQFVVNQYTVEQGAGPVVVWPYAQWVPELYGSGIGVTKTTAQQRPEVVRRFNRAALRGLRHAVDNPQQAGQVMAGRREELDPDAVAAGNQALAAYVHPDEGLELGQFDQNRLVQGIALLQSLGALAGGWVEPEDVVRFDLAQ